MMELAHSLVLNDTALQQISDSKKPIFIFEWLRFLDKVLVAAQRSDIKDSQKKLIEQLTGLISQSPGPPLRKLLARNIATLYSIGDTYLLFDTVNKCNDVIRSKDDSPSYLPSRLSAVSCLGLMYEKLGRLAGGLFVDTVQLLLKSLKSSESQGRGEIMTSLAKILTGLGSAGASTHKEIYKVAKGLLTDRSMHVRCASATCLIALVNESQFIYTSELDAIASACFRSLDGSNYDVRCAVAKLLGSLLASRLTMKVTDPKLRKPTLDDCLEVMSSGFLRGGSGFLKGSEVLKGGSVCREIRVGITESYVVFAQTLGSKWLEKNMSQFMNHVTELVAQPRATSTHVDTVYSRKCVCFILASTIGRVLSEKAQVSAARHFAQIITKQMNSVIGNDPTSDGASERVTSSNDTNNTQHVIVCALIQLGQLVESLNTSASPLLSEPSGGILESVFSVLLHPSQPVRLSAAWCLRSIAVALPSQLTPILDRCLDRLTALKSSPDAVSGYSFATAALVGAVYKCPLGIPYSKGKAVFTLGEDLLRTATQNSRMSLHRTQAGWLILGALMTLGSSAVRQHLPRMLLLWKNSFPRSSKELESEKARGDAFTWQVTLEGRAGALSTMRSFINNCQELMSEDVIRRLMTPLECALSLLGTMPSIINVCGAHLKASAAMLRLRLYEVLAILPASGYESCFNVLLRQMVAEITLTDNAANTTTSLLRSMCHADDSVLLGSWLQETDHKDVEDQLQPNSASGSGALEHDPSTVYSRSDTIPGPLPLGVAVIDSAVVLFGVVFPHVAHKHRLQMLQHFGECIKQAKSLRQQAIQVNIFTGVLSGLKGLADNKCSLGALEVRSECYNLVMSALTNQNPILRCAAGEAVGRMAQVVNDGAFIAQAAQFSFDRLKSARDVVSRTGNSLALGCLHRYVGGMGAGHHLGTSVSILLALAQDSSSPVVQVWSLHALALIIDSGGPMFRQYVEPTLALVLNLLLNVAPSNVDVHQCLGRCLASLITSLGPELQGNTGNISTARLSCLVGCAIMQDHPDSFVQAEAINCLQQLHLFAPRHVNLTTLVPHLCFNLNSSYLLLRRAVVACLRQLVQREAPEVSHHATKYATDNKDHSEVAEVICDSGLQGFLFSMYDNERDTQLRSDIMETVTSLLQLSAFNNLTQWLSLLKVFLCASADTAQDVADEDHHHDDAGDDTTFKANTEGSENPLTLPRWQTRIFATQCLRRILAVCQGTEAHFDYFRAVAMPTSENSKGDYLVLHLSDLIKLAFMASTSNINSLRSTGLLALQEVILNFGKVPDPDFPEYFLLEQYQAQVGAALRPAFSSDTPSDVTARACEVCSTWIGSGVATDINDLRRVHQLLVSSLAKVQVGKPSSTIIYSDSAATMERLAVLKAWAQVYIVAMRNNASTGHTKQRKPSVPDSSDTDDTASSLLDLVKCELSHLSTLWLAALKDNALLNLPSEFQSQLPEDGGAFYAAEAMESSRTHYQNSCAPILHAAAVWLHEIGFENVKDELTTTTTTSLAPSSSSASASSAITLTAMAGRGDRVNEERFYLILGTCVESLCNQRSTVPTEDIISCLQALSVILEGKWPRSMIGSNPDLSVELLNVLHRILLIRDNVVCQHIVLNVVQKIIKAAQEDLNHRKGQKNEVGGLYGEGGATGEIRPGDSLVFGVLQVCLCLLMRYVKALNPNSNSAHIQQRGAKTEETAQLVATSVTIMSDLLPLCSPEGSLTVLPTILHLTTTVLYEMAANSNDSRIPQAVNTVLQGLKSTVASPVPNTTNCAATWKALLRSTLYTILEYTKLDGGRNLNEHISMLSIAVIILGAPKEVTLSPSLLSDCTEFQLRTLSAEDPALRLKCLQTLLTIFSSPERQVAIPFIHTLAPKIIEYLHGMGTSNSNNDGELSVIIEAIKVCESLISLAAENNKIHLIKLLIPILTAFLVNGSDLKVVSQSKKSLHEHALQRTMEIGLTYPNQFKSIMSAAPQLKTRLEESVRASQAGKKSFESPTTKPKSVQPAQPSIKLKMNFNDFTG